MFLFVGGRIYPLEARPSAVGADVVSFELFQPTLASFYPSLNPTEDTPIHDLSLVPNAGEGSGLLFRFLPLTLILIVAC